MTRCIERLWLCGLLLAAGAVAATDIPLLTERIVDNARKGRRFHSRRELRLGRVVEFELVVQQRQLLRWRWKLGRRRKLRKLVR